MHPPILPTRTARRSRRCGRSASMDAVKKFRVVAPVAIDGEVAGTTIAVDVEAEDLDEAAELAMPLWVAAKRWYPYPGVVASDDAAVVILNDQVMLVDDDSDTDKDDE